MSDDEKYSSGAAVISSAAADSSSAVSSGGSSSSSGRKKLTKKQMKQLKKCHELSRGLKKELKASYLKRIEQDPSYLRSFSESSSVPIERKISKMRHRRQLDGHYGKIYSLDTSHAGCLVSGGLDENVIVWDLLSGYKNCIISERVKQVTAVCFSPNSDVIAVGGMSNHCKLFNIEDESEAASLESHNGYITKCQFLSESTLATASGDGTVKIWDITKKSKSFDSEFSAHGKHVTSMDVSVERQLVVTSSFDGIAMVWDPRTNPREAHRGTFAGHKQEMTVVRWFPSASVDSFATAGDDGRIILWDSRTRRALNTYSIQSSDRAATEDDDLQIYAIEFSKSGASLFAGTGLLDSYCVGFDTLTGDLVHNMEHKSEVMSMAMDKKGEVLLTGTSDSDINYWV